MYFPFVAVLKFVLQKIVDEHFSEDHLKTKKWQRDF